MGRIFGKYGKTKKTMALNVKVQNDILSETFPSPLNYEQTREHIYNGTRGRYNLEIVFFSSREQ